MLNQILRFESVYQIKQPSFIILLIALLGYGVVINANTIGSGMDLLSVNSPYRLNYFIALTSVISVFIAMIFSVNTLLRDKDYNFDEVAGMLAIKQQIVARTVAILLSTLTIISMLLFGLMLGMLSPEIDENKTLPFSMLSYLLPWLVFTLPNVIIVTAILVCSTLIHKNAFTTYLTAVSLFALFWASMIFIGAPVTGSSVFKDPSVVNIFALIDPFGTSAYFQQSQFWTPIQKNQQLVSFSGTLLLNRIIWLSIALVGLVWISRRGSLHAKDRNYLLAKKDKPKTVVNKSESKKSSMDVSVVPVSQGVQYHLSTFKTLLAIEVKLLLSSWLFWVFTLLVTGLSIVGLLMAVGVFSDGTFSGSYPTTSLLISYSTEAFIPLVTAFIVFYSAEKIWQEKLLQANSFVECSPVSTGTIYSAKLFSLCFIPVLLLSINIAVSLLFQVANDYYRFDIARYFLLYYFTLMPVLIHTVWIVFIQIIVANRRWANKYAAMVISALVVILLATATDSIGIFHPLVHINQLPSLLRIDSDFTGFGMFATKFHYLFVLWGGLALIIGCFSVLIWRRGARLTPSFMRWLTGRGKTGIASTFIKLTAMLTVSWVMVGVFLHFSMPPINDYQSPNNALDNQARYEHEFKKYQSLPIPQVTNMKMTVDFFPQQQRYEVFGEYDLLNETSEAITEVFVTSRKPLKSIVLDNATISSSQATPNWNVYVFKLAAPLLPNSGISLKYKLQHQSMAFAIDQTIVTNGTYLHHSDFEPLLGYVDRIEIKDNFERKNRGLLPFKKVINNRKIPNNKGIFIQRKRSFEAIISTSSEQTAVTSGALIKSWETGERRYFHYKSQEPIHPLVGYFSGAYKQKRVIQDGIPVEIYYYPTHKDNIDEILRATEATLNYASSNIAPYAFDSLRIVEVPMYHPFGGKASAGVIALSEKLFIEDYQDNAAINNTARNTIHEVLHQWWGENLVPKITQGEGVLIESMTKYMEGIILANMYGEEMRRSLAKYTQRRYFSGRAYSSSDEVGLVDAGEEPYITYGKGPIVLSAIEALLGEYALNRALKQLLKEHKFGLSATTDDLLDALLSVANEHQKTLINSWFMDIFEYDLSIISSEVISINNGLFEVLVDVEASRIFGSDDSQRKAIDEPITLAFYDVHPNRQDAKLLHQETHYLNDIQSLITMVTNTQPAYVVIDPNYTRLDKSLSNNIALITQSNKE